MKPTIRLAERHDALDLSPRLRRADAGEFLANGRCPTAGLLRAVDLSALVRTIVAPDGAPIALFGFAEIRPDCACPWLVGSEALVTTHRSWFLRASADIVASGDHRWATFFNRVDARNVVHIRWLRWSGFLLQPAEPFGPHGMHFHPFTRTRPCVTSPLP